jgi:hypothetical protein
LFLSTSVKSSSQKDGNEVFWCEYKWKLVCELEHSKDFDNYTLAFPHEEYRSLVWERLDGIILRTGFSYLNVVRKVNFCLDYAIPASNTMTLMANLLFRRAFTNVNLECLHL